MSIEDQCQAIMATLAVERDGPIVTVTGSFEGRKFQAIASNLAARPELALSLTKRMVALQMIQAGAASVPDEN